MELTRYGRRVAMRESGNDSRLYRQKRFTFFVFRDPQGRYCLLQRGEARFFKSEIREVLWPEHESAALGQISQMRLCRNLAGLPCGIIRLRDKDNPVIIDTQRLPVDVVIMKICNIRIDENTIRNALYGDESDVDRIMQIKSIWLTREDMVKLTTSVKMQDIIVDVINALP